MHAIACMDVETIGLHNNTVQLSRRGPWTRKGMCNIEYRTTSYAMWKAYESFKMAFYVRFFTYRLYATVFLRSDADRLLDPDSRGGNNLNVCMCL